MTGRLTIICASRARPAVCAGAALAAGLWTSAAAAADAAGAAVPEPAPLLAAGIVLLAGGLALRRIDRLQALAGACRRAAGGLALALPTRLAAAASVAAVVVAGLAAGTAWATRGEAPLPAAADSADPS
ncbi:MAG: hypothetical protein AB7K86_07885 [Rhodospirillales bacterium]